MGYTWFDAREEGDEGVLDARLQDAHALVLEGLIRRATLPLLLLV